MLIERPVSNPRPTVLALALLLLAGACGYAAKAVGQPADAGAQTRNALRLLGQSTFGATRADLAEVQSIGIPAYLTRQFGYPRTGYNGFTYFDTAPPVGCQKSAAYPESVQSLCARDNYSLFEVQRQFFANAMTGRDQLRQRVAFALSQIFVVSGTEISHAAGMASYQNLLLDHAFGNYRELLEAVTLHPVMGRYLDMANNAVPRYERQANENYARECLQLFSIGIERLNPDGSIRVDAAGAAIPAYDQGVVDALARAFTGWTYAPRDGAASTWPNPINYIGSMVPEEARHDTQPKVLFDGVTLPAGRSAREDLEAALDAIYRHPNVGPFIGKRLIQHLVTSNPTPAYVARVAAKFANNGQRVRGDLRAVVQAILLDPEARGARMNEPDFGRLKDPVLYMTGLLRALDGQSDGVYLRDQAAAMGQNVFVPPSVFGFYPSANFIRGTPILGPEFGIYEGQRALARPEFAYKLLYAGGVRPSSTVAGSTGTSINLTTLAALPAAKLPDELNVRLMDGRLPAETWRIVDGALAAVGAGDATARAQLAAYLLAISPQYQVLR